MMGSRLNKLIFITGASKGIGRALTIELLENGHNVMGLCRSAPDIEHVNFKFVQLDLSRSAEVENFSFPETHFKEIVLVNNAGIIGEILPIGDLNSRATEKMMQVNVNAVIALTNLFYSTYKSNVGLGQVLTIGSGAGYRPIDAWSTYCASKAAVGIFMECFKAELETRAVKNWYVHTISPGVVDTDMQLEIRNADENKFLAKNKFLKFKNQGELKSPKLIGERIRDIIEAPSLFADVLIQL